MKSETIALAMAGIAALSPPAAASAEPIERVGYAYEMNGDELLYTEEHEEWLEDGMVVRSNVTYRGADGDVIATKSLDFSSDLTSPEFRLDGVANGHIEGARQEADHFVVFFRKTGDEKLEEKKVDVPDKAIIDGGFDRFIEINWDSLMEGEVFKRPFLVPSFHKFIDFKIYLEKTSDTEVTFIMEPASFVLRFFAEEILVTYTRNNAALRRYEGISNIRDQEGENYDVRVEFPAAAERGSDKVAAGAAN